MEHPDRSVLPDPLLEEIRAVKRSISEQFGHDVRMLCMHLRREQEASSRRVIRRREEPPATTKQESRTGP